MSNDYPELEKITQTTIKESASKYLELVKRKLEEISATSHNGQDYSFEEGVNLAMEIIFKAQAQGGKLIFIGNGASASISSHLATDFWKNAGIRAISFNDSALLTAIGNDYGYKYVFAKPVEMFSEPKDVLIAVSSSGKSENILRGVYAARKKSLKVITLSGFRKDNPLRNLGEVNFYVPVEHYGHVETVHSFICHCLVDMAINKRDG